ncbi:MAG: alpha-ketoglutarate dehydrogenase [Sterolibacterium sp.]|jgi:pyruvate dehydrogenase E1 component
MNNVERSLAGAFPDADPQETAEWLEALSSVARQAGNERALHLLHQLEFQAQQLGIVTRIPPYSAYQNTIPLDRQGAYPGDLALEERISAMIRWNALAMVLKANKVYGDLGGHIASFASAAEIFETGFNHFFRGPMAPGGADLVYFQPHSAPGVYARAFLEGRLSESHLDRYRQETGGGGLSSYPHPWLMPDFWQFPTGSMGLGPITSIYQARFMRYLEHRGLARMGERHVWGVFGDGEMDEPEAIGGLTLAAREGLDNLTFIVNCNLQRLDGPVRGNGQVIQELEALFSGAGWNVIKVLWGSDWDPLFARDHSHALLKRFAATVDGQYQTLGANNGTYNQEHFFKLDEELQALVAHMTPQEIDALKRGGHDFRKLYAAFAAARAHQGQPTVILAKTKKGYGMGATGESRMTTHSQKQFGPEDLHEFRDRFHLPLSDEDIAELRFINPGEDSRELKYLRQRREALGGYLPQRAGDAPPLPVPPLTDYAQFALHSDGKEMSSTMAFVRMLSGLLKNPVLGPRLVPIVADEARTFGMAGLFRQVGIYSPVGQLYAPEDESSMLFYRESKDGQLLEEGITEAGALSSWIAAGTSYAVHGLPMLPVYIYYSMFGFQRVGDLIWAAADQRARGFLVGATSGRTTLGGEGLQHQDGSSLLVASTIPTCRAYDPTFAYEVAVLFEHGMKRMLEDRCNEFYYLTVTNENYAHPSAPDGVAGNIVKGMYRLAERPGKNDGKRVCLLGSGAILHQVMAAAEMLEKDWGIASEVFSVTSYSELAREANAAERWNRLHPTAARRTSHVEDCLAGATPVVAASDYVRAWPNLIAPHVGGSFTVLGTDGFGRSDTRTALRKFFEVDRQQIVVAALYALSGLGQVSPATVSEAISRYQVATDTAAPWTC